MLSGLYLHMTNSLPNSGDSRQSSSGNRWGDEPYSDRRQTTPNRFGLASIFRAKILIPGLIVAATAAAIGYAFVQRGPERPANRPAETALSDGISSDGIPVQRSVLHCLEGDVLLEHFPKKFEPTHGFAIPREGEYATLFSEEDKAWYTGFERGMVLTSFNCGAFAVGPFVGLTVEDVVDGIDRQEYGNPMEVVLKSYFEQIGTYNLRHPDGKASFERNDQLQDNDVVCFVDPTGPSLLHVHAGRIKQQDGRNLVLSKFGRRGPILLADLPFVARHYPSVELRVFRYRGHPVDNDPVRALPMGDPVR